jgi:hypothetical protein
MAQLTPAEFTDLVNALAGHYGVERLRDRLARMNAFTSRRGLNTAAAMADRLQLLTGGLRRPVAATYAVSQLWNELVGTCLGDDREKRLETIVEQVNACLTTDENLAPGKEDDLDRALVAYRDVLVEAAGADVARLDMLLKAVPAVAERIRRGLPGATGEPTRDR